MDRSLRIVSIGRRTASKTVVGNAWTQVISLKTTGRNAVRITNNDASVTLAVTYVQTDSQGIAAQAPAVANVPVASMAEDYIAAKQTLTINLPDNVDIYAANDTGAGTTSQVTLREVS